MTNLIRVVWDKSNTCNCFNELRHEKIWESKIETGCKHHIDISAVPGFRTPRVRQLRLFHSWTGILYTWPTGFRSVWLFHGQCTFTGFAGVNGPWLSILEHRLMLYCPEIITKQTFKGFKAQPIPLFPQLLGRSLTDATRLRFGEEKITLQSPTGRTFSSQWRFSHQRDYDAMTTRHGYSVVDFFLDRITVASPQWENGLTNSRTVCLNEELVICYDSWFPTCTFVH
jgi:hypothetical protein